MTWAMRMPTAGLWPPSEAGTDGFCKRSDRYILLRSYGCALARALKGAFCANRPGCGTDRAEKDMEGQDSQVCQKGMDMKRSGSEGYGALPGKGILRDSLILAAILLFTLFHILKVNGYLDFSGKYDIKELGGSREALNLELILDGEPKTEWGALYGVELNDYLEIAFRKEREIHSVKLDCGECPKLVLFSQDPVSWEWIKQPVRRQKDGTVLTLVPKKAFSAERILLLVADAGDTGGWTVREIVIE